MCCWWCWMCWLVLIVLKWKVLISLLFEDERGQSDGKSWSATGGERCWSGEQATTLSPVQLCPDRAPVLGLRSVSSNPPHSSTLALSLPLQLYPVLEFRSIPGNTGMQSLSISCRVHSELGSDSLSQQLAKKGQDCLDEIRLRNRQRHEMRFCLRASQTFTNMADWVIAGIS